MAEINARKRGRRWEYYFEVARVKGKRKRFSKGGFTTKADALSAGTKAMNDYLNAVTVFVPKELSVSDYMDHWIEMYCRPNLKPSTIASYKKYIRLHISPKIGHYLLTSISAEQLQSLINDLVSEGFSKNTFNFHSLRHTHCTRLLEAGLPLKYVQERLGHKCYNEHL